MSLRVVRVPPARLPPRLVLFKSTCGEPSLEAWRAASAGLHPPSDWSALYLQLNEPHALGTLPYRFDQGCEEATLLRVELPSEAVSVLLAVDPSGVFASPNISGEEKAALVKAQLGAEGRLTDWLGAQGCLLVCAESSEEWEVVLPFALLPRVAATAEAGRFRARGGMLAWRRDGDGWRRFDDSDVAAMVNEPPAWLAEALAAAAAEAEQTRG